LITQPGASPVILGQEREVRSKTFTFYKVVRRHPETGELVDSYTGKLVYAVGAETVDPAEHGLSVHTGQSFAIGHKIPGRSVGASWPAVLLRVSVEPADIVTRGYRAEKTLVRRLRVVSIERDIHPEIAQRGLSVWRVRDAESWIANGWGGFKEVGYITRGARKPSQIDAAGRARYRIECRPASAGNYGKNVDYRAVPI
jgi:hypothetical protein